MKLWKIGEIGVDSGHIVVLDPGMASSLDMFDQWYTEDSEWKQIKFPSAVSVHMGGDGDYPVYALLSDDAKTILGIMVWMDEDGDDLPFEEIIAIG